jgi:hypothetical protein
MVEGKEQTDGRMAAALLGTLPVIDKFSGINSKFTELNGEAFLIKWDDVRLLVTLPLRDLCAITENLNPYFAIPGNRTWDRHKAGLEKNGNAFKDALGKYERLLEVATDHVFSGRLKLANGAIALRGITHQEDMRVEILTFVNWATGLGLDMPEELRHMGTADNAVASYGNKWPWGDYETDLLKKMSEAAQKFWANFDPSNPNSAPVNTDVSRWLEKQGVSRATAEAMASILRHDSLPKSGRRKK